MKKLTSNIKANLTALLLMMLLATSCFSQKTAIVVNDSVSFHYYENNLAYITVSDDTIMNVSPAQLKDININYLQLEICNKVNAEFSHAIVKQQEEIDLQYKLINSKNTQLEYCYNIQGLTEEFYKKKLKNTQKITWTASIIAVGCMIALIF